MRTEYLWWTRVEAAAQTINSIKRALGEDKSVFFFCDSNGIPWKKAFYEIFRKEAAEISSQKSFAEVKDNAKIAPDYQIFETMCPKLVRDEYWPSMSYAEFLAERDDIVLNSRIVWVSGIENEDRLEKWLAFAADYDARVREYDHDHALFVLEYVDKGGMKMPPRSIKMVRFMPTEFDRYIYCLSGLSESDARFSLKQYAAELACCIGGNDIELCGRLAGCGIELYRNPQVCIRNVTASVRSDGTKHREITDDEIYAALLMAQIKIVFPAIERFRSDFIRNNTEKLKENLPITNFFGEKIDEPKELELSDLRSIAQKFNSGFGEEEKRTLEAYRNYRNMLAHNDVITWRNVERILSR